MATGVVGQITAFSKPTVTIAGLSGALSTDNKITISGASTSTNNGTFPITLFVGSTSVKYDNIAGVSPDAAGAHVTWTTSRDILISDDLSNPVGLEISLNINNQPVYLMTGWYATSSTWETWVATSYLQPPPSGHALTFTYYVKLSGGG
jgi:hypothetical protein